MGLFGFGKKKEIDELRRENVAQSRRIRQLEKRCEEKDSYFMELMSDGLKHGSKLASKHMNDRKKYLKGK